MNLCHILDCADGIWDQMEKLNWVSIALCQHGVRNRDARSVLVRSSVNLDPSRTRSVLDFKDCDLISEWLSATSIEAHHILI